MKNYFASFIPAVKAILGIEAWSKDADKKDALLEEQKQKLKALNFNDTFINGFCEALKDGFPEDSARKDGESDTKGSGPDPNTSNAVIQGLLADMTAKLVTAQEEIAVLTKEKGELSPGGIRQTNRNHRFADQDPGPFRPCGAGRGERLPACTSGTGR